MMEVEIEALAAKNTVSTRDDTPSAQVVGMECRHPKEEQIYMHKQQLNFFFAQNSAPAYSPIPDQRNIQPPILQHW